MNIDITTEVTMVGYTQPMTMELTSACCAVNDEWNLIGGTVGQAQTAFYLWYGASMITLPQAMVITRTAHDWWKFQGLRSRWHDERGATSSITEMAMCDSYLRIIGMGQKAVPLILHQMEREGSEPDQWFWALQILTEADPVPEEERGDFEAMSRTWRDWAARNWYTW
jgi:hypothetical protein